MLRDEIVDYLDAYVASFEPPLREGVTRHGPAQRSAARLHARDHRRRLPRRPGGDRGGRLPDPGDPALRRAARSGSRADPFLRIPQSATSCRPARCWWWAAASRAARSPRTCTSPAARCISCVGERAAHGAPLSRQGRRRLAATSWATTTCRCTSTRCARACATRPTTTSPAATAAATSTCASARARAWSSTAACSTSRGGRLMLRRRPRAQSSTRPTPVSESIKTSIDKFIAKRGIDAPDGGPLPAGLGAVPTSASELDYRARRHHLGSSGASASAPTTAGSTCRSSTAAGYPPMSAASPPCPASTSSGCPGSTPGARAASPASRATPSISPSASRRGSA